MGTESCTCSDGFYAFTTAQQQSSCVLCPARGGLCTNGGLVPRDGFFHSSPESADMQECPLLKACSWSGGPQSRTGRLLALQRDALESSNYSATLTSLALAGKFDLAAYRDAQCAEGCAGPSMPRRGCSAAPRPGALSWLVF